MKIALFVAVIFTCFIAVFKLKNVWINILVAAILISLFTYITIQIKEGNRNTTYAITRGKMGVLAQRLKDFHAENPDFNKMTDIQKHELGIKNPTDQYGQPIKVTLTADSLELMSYAADGKPGGEEEKQDIIVRWKKGDEDLSFDAWENY